LLKGTAWQQGRAILKLLNFHKPKHRSGLHCTSYDVVTNPYCSRWSVICITCNNLTKTCRRSGHYEKNIIFCLTTDNTWHYITHMTQSEQGLLKQRESVFAKTNSEKCLLLMERKESDSKVLKQRLKHQERNDNLTWFLYWWFGQALTAAYESVPFAKNDVALQRETSCRHSEANRMNLRLATISKEMYNGRYSCRYHRHYSRLLFIPLAKNLIHISISAFWKNTDTEITKNHVTRNFVHLYTV